MEKAKVKQLTKKQAIKFYDLEAWVELSHKERAEFQLMQKRVCMPFHVFHEAVEKALGRPVYTHEYGMNKEGLIDELFHDKTPPDLHEILNMIPEEKRLVVIKKD